jgi:vacuolar protein-sorting-associated protein 4
MEVKKIEEARSVVRQASALLRAHLQKSPHTPLSDRELKTLRELLQQLLPSLSILRSYEQHHHHYRCVYATVESAVEQVLLRAVRSETAEAPPRRKSDAPDNLTSEHPSEAAGQCMSTTAPHAVLGDPRLSRGSAARKAPLWKDIYGCAEAILALRQATTLPARYPALFTGPRRPWRRLLLYGPPGTGKTQLAAATAAEFSAVFLSVSAADLLSKWVGESEKQVRHAFTQAAAAGPRCVLFFDEVDALCNARGGHGESEVARRLKTEFLVHLQNTAASVLVLAATNLPWELDAAIVRRFDRLVHVGLPSRHDKVQFAHDELRGVAHVVTDAQLSDVVARTEGFSLVDMRRLVSYAVMAPVTEWLSRRPDADEAAASASQNTFNSSNFDIVDLGVASADHLRCVKEVVQTKGSQEDVLGDMSSGSGQSAPTDTTAALVCTSSRGTTQSSADTLHRDELPTTCVSTVANVCESGVPPVEARHFEEALRCVSATTSLADATRYAAWSSHSA